MKENAKNRFTADYEEWVTLNGDRQNIRVRSKDIRNPVILFLHGGPGVCDRHWVMHYQSSLARHYTMVLWDQRGSGKSYRNSVRSRIPQVEEYIQDARVLVEYLCQCFEQDKIIIAGHSWGTVIGTALASRYPEHIMAYISQGQVVNGAENERISYEFCLEEARKRKDEKALEKLEGNAPVKGVYPSAKAMRAQRDCLTRYGGSDSGRSAAAFQTGRLQTGRNPGLCKGSHVLKRCDVASGNQPECPHHKGACHAGTDDGGTA